jgi:predicted RNA-binding protein with PUA-like domain
VNYFLARSEPDISAIYSPKYKASYGYLANAVATERLTDAAFASLRTGGRGVRLAWHERAIPPPPPRPLAGKKKPLNWREPEPETGISQKIVNGVVNSLALRTIRSMRPGDRVFVYTRTGPGYSSIAGLADVQSEHRADPRNSESSVVEIRFIALLDPPATFDEIKNSGLFDDWTLVRQQRLTPMPAPATFVEWMRARYPNVPI